MTFAPPTLVSLGKYLVAHDAVNLGIVGDQSHAATGTSYHLGRDQLIPGAYSAKLPRDKAGLSLAASAIDIGRIDGTLKGLQRFSNWLVGECMRGYPNPLYHDLREVIFSPDGQTVWRWDAVNNQLATGPGQGDDSHLTHTHLSWYRDSEFRSKIQTVSPYFEVAMATVTKVIRQEWTAVGTNGVLRAAPDRSYPVAERLPAGTLVTSVCEAVDATVAAPNHWRLTEWPQGTPRWFLESGPGVPAGHDFLAGPVVEPDCSTAVSQAIAATKASAHIVYG